MPSASSFFISCYCFWPISNICYLTVFPSYFYNKEFIPLIFPFPLIISINNLYKIQMFPHLYIKLIIIEQSCRSCDYFRNLGFNFFKWWKYFKFIDSKLAKNAEQEIRKPANKLRQRFFFSQLAIVYTQHILLESAIKPGGQAKLHEWWLNSSYCYWNITKTQ